ncbi:zinc finger protein 511 [Tachyglossus aculeatus]|uniref:zinc finger protein 511 n=1 Tax=Tachyglossus aculeatus TaxID=9261 RepID=UPI0018F480A9|nr:zinc finger protein 511 [Tachyglossus aculeatus]
MSGPLPLPVAVGFGAGARTGPFRFAPRRLRFPRHHPIFEDGDVQRHLYLQDVITQVGEVIERPKVSEFSCPAAGCCQVFDTLEGYEHHYNTLHRNVCSFCKRSFPSGHLLDTHILEWHDALFQILSEKQNMYQCLVAGCAEKFETSRARKDHLVKVHLYPSDFRFDRPKKTRGQMKQSPAGGKNEVPAMSVEAAGGPEEPSGADAMEVCPGEGGQGAPAMEESPTPTALPEKPAYSSRIPTTICFGQGATRGFKSTKKRNKRP